MLPLRRLQWPTFSRSPTLCRACLLQSRFTNRRYASLLASSFPTLATQETSKLQIYQSLSKDPFVNLSIENYLLEHSPVDSNILFLYINQPCVVIGRNQNPWLETNLHLLDRKQKARANDASVGDGSLKNALLVRRRSGGGAVFHDEGNLNYSVICPKSIFTRDKHAEMVVRALKRVGAVSAKVNERHDIVLGRDESEEPSTNVVSLNSEDAESPKVEATPRALKISGSAYKLSRLRAMHHGTCLINSPNLTEISVFLRSPARPYLQARGVDSVKSPVGNVSSAVPAERRRDVMPSVISQIMREFAEMYGVDDGALAAAQNLYGSPPQMVTGNNCIVGSLSDSIVNEEPEIKKGVKELQSPEWKYEQSPQFTFSSQPTDDDPRPRPPVPEDELDPASRVFLRMKSGEIIESHISMSADDATAQTQAKSLHAALSGQKLHEISRWKPILGKSDISAPNSHIRKLAQWLHSKLGH